MPTVEFGSRQAANRFRDSPAVKPHLTAGDDRRSTTVRLQSGTPDRVINRAESEAFKTQGQDRGSAGMAELSDAEIQSLERQHRTFSWQQHGFEAMRAKAALQRAGVTDWQDHWEPGEGVEGALSELQRTKQMSARTGAPASVERGRRTDEESVTGGARRRQQAEAFEGEQIRQARREAIVGVDRDAQDFLREGQAFGEDPFDLRFVDDPDGRGKEPLGPTAELLEQRHASRSLRAQRTDNRLAAPKTTDPIEWANNPDELDFPGIDTKGEPLPDTGRPPELDLSGDNS